MATVGTSLRYAAERCKDRLSYACFTGLEDSISGKAICMVIHDHGILEESLFVKPALLEGESAFSYNQRCSVNNSTGNGSISGPRH